MALIKRHYRNQETVITAENLNDIQDAIIALEEDSFSIDNEKKGEAITITDAATKGFRRFSIYGKTTQDGTPSPEAPVELVSVGDGGSITVDVTGAGNAQSMTIATPNGLPGIPVASGGNYTDANGQQWICDEIDLARGVYVQRVGVFTADGTEKWGLSDTANVFGCTKLSSITYTNIGYCSHFINKATAAATLKNGEYTLRVTGTVYIKHDMYSTANEFSAWLTEQYNSGTPVVLYYHLATPVETPLSEEEIAAYKALHTYKERTTVSNDAGAYMALEYAMDAKKYIDSLASGTIIPATVE